VIKGNGGVEFTVTANDHYRYRIGLVNTQSTSANILYMDYGIYITSFDSDQDGDQDLRILSGGLGAGTLDDQTYALGDTFSISRNGSTIYFKRNNTTFHQIAGIDEDATFVAKAIVYDQGTHIEDFGLFGDNIDKCLQYVDYDYNVRGWLTDINNVNDGGIFSSGENDLFKFRINYDGPVIGTAAADDQATPLYNGNISQTLWRTTNTDTQLRAYAFKYDPVNRIKVGYSRKGEQLDINDDYSIWGIGYDFNGNILNLIRNGKDDTSIYGHSKMDQLSYFYNGNQLLKVEDQTTSTLINEGFYDGNTIGDDYNYDVNGNMIQDKNKGISQISYNHLNLPTALDIQGTDATGVSQDGRIAYIYDATGVKLQKTVQDAIQGTIVTTSYAGGYLYEDIDGLEQLKLFPHPEGYVEPLLDATKTIGKFSKSTDTFSLSGFLYAFNYTDHLGNVRLTYADGNADGFVAQDEIISEKQFGLQQKGYNDQVSGNVNSTANKFKYNGTEQEQALGLNLYEMPFRQFDPAIARFTAIDPVTHHSYSTYNAFDNNPVFWADPSGANAVSVSENPEFDTNQEMSGFNAGNDEWIPGKDGKAITYSTDNDGNITVSENATDDTKQLVAGINKSGSEKAKNQFKGIADSEGKVNLNINKTDTGVDDTLLNGLHQPHDSNGRALNWDRSSQSFDGTAETFIDSNGNTVYAEATITIFETNFNSDTNNVLGVYQKTGVFDPGLTKLDTMIGTFSHEVFHNLDSNTIQTVIDRSNGVQNNYSVEPPAYKVQAQVHQEIKKNRK